jgi:hypothetical protein
VEQSGSINFLQGRNRYRDRYRYRTISSDPWRGGVFLRAVAPVPGQPGIAGDPDFSIRFRSDCDDFDFDFDRSREGTAHNAKINVHIKGQDMQVLRAGYAGFTGRICRFYGHAGFSGIQKFRRLNAIQGRFEFDIACRGALFQ